MADEGDARSDADLLAAHVAGDRDAFAVLIARHRAHLWAVAARTSLNDDDAADALQEALLSAHRGARSFRSDAKVSSWLHRIVVNAALDRMRRERHRQLTAPLDAATDGIADPVDATGHVDLRLSVGGALATLPADQRAAVVAVDVEGYSVADAATLLGVPTGTVKSRCARGRAKLAVSLGHLRATDLGSAEGTTRASAASDGGERPDRARRAGGGS
ncbi:RNA polymerase sigma factor SigM [Williamsia deligens]|uniref:RNA polymerase sigma factor SigM n=1 Tax=Williamsia deligens TaxID=321325 RepID=A0ABW3G5R2_9NOCA|nr:RNA polymerase sigma factor SigM [Williamsia deligens]MCP2193816.1 RNA polymerase sigma-70 factor, ECF subfamily [Williamsia deligens]